MTHGIARIRLDDGTHVWARVSDVQELGRGGGFTDTGVRDRVVSMSGGLTDVVRGVVGSLRAGLDPQGPVEVAVSFGIELSAQSGKVIGVLADGSGKASVNVSLTWTEEGRAPAQAPATAQASPTAQGSASTQAPEPAQPPAHAQPPAPVRVPPAPTVPPARSETVPPAPATPPAAPPAPSEPPSASPVPAADAPESASDGRPAADGTV
ncbi:MULTISPECIES: CU044_2847 family protein [unclassified Streptomyces]|uniref:CU044_2847 family protein n=1 Tax=unclassified Streptomyces TaxID=2593676 RepID=UPI000A7E9602|nr:MULTISPECIES: CU044_2847 family protein [unclassified Streptomyces]